METLKDTVAMLPLNIKLNDIFTFNIEVPYYNWFYPLQHTIGADNTPFDHEVISLDQVKGVYIHVPFCSSLCSFCPYIRTNIHNAEMRNRYVKQLVKEIMSYQRDTKPEIDCIFFGGGSPSLLSPENFVEIMNAVQKVFNVPPNCEITIEANAMTLNPDLCSVFRDHNVTTVRIGVQSFNQRSRELYHLKATVDNINNAVELARKYDIQVSLDLLFGHHGQEFEAFLKDIEQAHNLNPDTIEIYPINLLSVPDRYWDSFLSAGLRGLSAQERVRYFKAGCDRLTELGYHQWSGHGFARSPEFDLLYHRCVYGTLGGIVSFGPAAISFGTDYVKWNHPGIEKYIDDMDRQLTPTFQIRKTRDYELTAKKVVTELPYYGFCHISDNDIIPEISDRLSELIDAGVVQQRNPKLVLSDTARYQYASAMFYLLPEYDKKAMGREIFSHCARLGEKLTIDMLWV